MKYFTFHISDYLAATTHLTNEHHGVYFRMLLTYYDKEAPLSSNVTTLARKFQTTPLVIERILEDYFIKTDQGYRHERCDKDIAAFNALKARNKQNSHKRFQPPLSGPGPAYDKGPGKINSLSTGPKKESLLSNHVTTKPESMFSGHPLDTESTSTRYPLDVESNIKPAECPPDVAPPVFDQFTTNFKIKPFNENSLHRLRNQATHAQMTLEEAMMWSNERGLDDFTAQMVNNEKYQTTKPAAPAKPKYSANPKDL